MNDDNKVKLSEKISHNFRKKWLVNGIQLFLIIAIFCVGYYCLYLSLDFHNFPYIDLTENKIHTLSDASKKAIEKIDKDISIYVYGYDEKASIFNLLEQYNKSNEKITYNSISEETDLTMINEYNLQNGYSVLIFKSGDSEKIVDSSELETYDYSVGDYIDVSEQTITNSILSLAEENKPKIYITEGHNEYTDEQLNRLELFLTNESFTFERLNIFLTNSIPEDCDILAIIGPSSDFMESEVDAIKKYVSNGGNIFIALEVLSSDKDYKNLQVLLDEYGVQYENGYILEYAKDKSSANTPFTFIPQISSDSTITKDIYSDGTILLINTGRIKIGDEDTLSSKNVTSELLLNSSEESTFISNLAAETLEEAMSTAETGESSIAATFEKTYDEDKVSKLVLCSTSSFMADITSEYVSNSYPLSYMANNIDFAINSMSYLGEKNYMLTIRKDFGVLPFTTTGSQDRIVLTIIFSVPLFIIFAGLIIWNYRKKKK